MTLQAGDFDLQALLPRQSVSGTLRVYLEGDGRAWILRDRPSQNPTPRNSMVLDLVRDDPRPSVYLARPCQYLASHDCKPHWWTHDRFAQTIVDSQSAALDKIKARLGNHDFELVGYSGGATMALLLAEQRMDVRVVQSLAGNLDPQMWATSQGLSALGSPTSPPLASPRIRQLPQRHLIGKDDRTITPTLSLEALRKTDLAQCREFHLLPGVNHHLGWQRAWQAFRDKPIYCPRLPD
ncbi:pimeloyl-ACP methyl ester carboxylesterase [Pseudomonas fluvialis]|uniref:Pimeloyl-ACP methyl ester carboxylesterase n=1 Tax=Pseudomonas fluvialis TaxID=1793966 RepID=A0A7X0ETW8_9PSED|nr:alpha/beta hydrolase [Pseudomonas fluvialis]MBB6341255.1 pimeloyl-ACP methyl ester carboxylesterase [Pseudomonas fluvialis]